MEQISIKCKNKCGVYSIFNLINGKRYVGSSIDIYNRLHEHFHNLKNNKAHNKHLQAAWNKYGEDAFKFNILEYCDVDKQFEQEQYYIDLMHPEYNLTEQVVATYGRELSEETKKKISDTLKRKYELGELSTYIRKDIMIKCFIYNIKEWTLVAECESLSEATKVLNIKNSTTGLEKIKSRIYCEKYIISLTKFDTIIKLKNFYYENYVKAKSKNINYIGVIDNNELIYFRSFEQCSKYIGCSAETLRNKKEVSIDNPYIFKGSNIPFFAVNEYIPLKETAVPIEESLELQSGNIGESPEEDNTEINSEITQGLESSYSVEGE